MFIMFIMLIKSIQSFHKVYEFPFKYDLFKL